MSSLTISEVLFEQLCARHGVACARIPADSKRTADYRLSLESHTLIAEVKQLDPSEADEELGKTWGTSNSPGALSPSDRVQRLISDGYPQIKRSCDGRWPGIIVVYNNSGEWNWIDTFTVARAMFGAFGIVLGLQSNQNAAVIGHGYLGKRKVTKDILRSLSAVGVLNRMESGNPVLDCYHNPFAGVPLQPSLLTTLANAQYLHPNPHERGFVRWEPTRIEV